MGGFAPRGGRGRVLLNIRYKWVGGFGPRIRYPPLRVSLGVGEASPPVFNNEACQHARPRPRVALDVSLTRSRAPLCRFVPLFVAGGTPFDLEQAFACLPVPVPACLAWCVFAWFALPALMAQATQSPPPRTAVPVAFVSHRVPTHPAAEKEAVRRCCPLWLCFIYSPLESGSREGQVVFFLPLLHVQKIMEFSDSNCRHMKGRNSGSKDIHLF